MIYLYAGTTECSPESSQPGTIVWLIADDDIRPSNRRTVGEVELYPPSFHVVPA
jgi:hypothetical protein